MKTSLFILCCTTIILASCQKSNIDNIAPTQNSYLNTKSGSSWNYHEINSSAGTPLTSDYTITSSSKDTTINTKPYHVYNYSYGGSQYLNITDHSYYQFDSIPGGLGQIFEKLYLKDDASVGVSWKQDLAVTFPGISISAPFTVTNTIVEKGISRIVNGINYTGVIHVSAVISSSLIPSASLTSAINSYYSPNYGLIENTSQVQLNYLGVTQSVNIETKLTSTTLK